MIPVMGFKLVSKEIAILRVLILILSSGLYIIADKHPIFNAMFVTAFSLAVCIWMHTVDLKIPILNTVGKASYAIYLCEGMLIYLWQDYYSIKSWQFKIIYGFGILVVGYLLYLLYKVVIVLRFKANKERYKG